MYAFAFDVLVFPLKDDARMYLFQSPSMFELPINFFAPN